MAVPLHARAEKRAIECGQRVEQRGRAIPFVTMRHGRRAGASAALPAGSDPRGVNLALLVHSTTPEQPRGIEIEANNGLQFFGELRVVADFKGSDQMWFQWMLDTGMHALRR